MKSTCRERCSRRPTLFLDARQPEASDLLYPYKRPSNPKGTPRSRKKRLTPGQQAHNADVRALRARVEMPFGALKTNFKCLSRPWFGAVELLDNVVEFASGLYSHEKK